ncbi:MAG: hypothetical protein WAL95_20500 [Candidatus Acidiferrales bacterium]
MGKRVIHISEEEAASDFASLMASVRAGAEVIIESHAQPVAVIHPAEPVRRTISECIALAKKHEEETAQVPVLDPDFAKDVGEIVNDRRPSVRLLSESLRLAEQHGSTATLDDGFSKYLEAAVESHREPLDPRAWD